MPGLRLAQRDNFFQSPRSSDRFPRAREEGKGDSLCTIVYKPWPVVNSMLLIVFLSHQLQLVGSISNEAPALAVALGRLCNKMAKAGRVLPASQLKLVAKNSRSKDAFHNAINATSKRVSEGVSVRGQTVRSRKTTTEPADHHPISALPAS